MSSSASLIDLACDRFEQQWREGRRPRIEAYLADYPRLDRPAFLDALLKVELWWRREHGERPTPQEYLKRFPEHGGLIDDAFGAAEGMPRPTSPPPLGGATGGR